MTTTDSRPGPAPSAIGEAPAPADTPIVQQRYVRFRDGVGQTVDQPVVGETRLSIAVDGTELVELMCSPHQLNALVVGFLYHEGLIETIDDVDAVRVCIEDRVAEVSLHRRLPEVPRRKIITLPWLELPAMPASEAWSALLPGGW